MSLSNVKVLRSVNPVKSASEQAVLLSNELGEKILVKDVENTISDTEGQIIALYNKDGKVINLVISETLINPHTSEDVKVLKSEDQNSLAEEKGIIISVNSGWHTVIKEIPELDCVAVTDFDGRIFTLIFDENKVA